MGQRPQRQGPGAAGSPRPDGMTYARSFICRPARFLKGRLVFQADYLLVRLPITKPTISRHTLYNSGHPLSSIIRSPVLHAYSPPSSICLDRHRSSVYRAHRWTASHQLYQEFGISEFLYSLQLSFVNLSFVVIFHCVLFSYSREKKYYFLFRPHTPQMVILKDPTTYASFGFIF